MSSEPNYIGFGCAEPIKRTRNRIARSGDVQNAVMISVTWCKETVMVRSRNNQRAIRRYGESSSVIAL